MLGLTFAPYRRVAEGASISVRKISGIGSQRVEDNAFHLCADEPPLPILGERMKVRGIFFA